MTKFAAAAKRFVKGEEGATMVEYGLMLALIAVICLTAVSTVGTGAKGMFNSVVQPVIPHRDTLRVAAPALSTQTRHPALGAKRRPRWSNQASWSPSSSSPTLLAGGRSVQPEPSQ